MKNMHADNASAKSDTDTSGDSITITAAQLFDTPSIAVLSFVDDIPAPLAAKMKAAGLTDNEKVQVMALTAANLAVCAVRNLPEDQHAAAMSAIAGDVAGQVEAATDPIMRTLKKLLGALGVYAGIA